MAPISYDRQLVWNFLDRFGRYYAVTPMHRKIMHRGKPGKCFANSRAFSNYAPDKVRYVEGLAGVRSGGTLHAWNRILPGLAHWIKAEVCVDTTWDLRIQRWHPWYCGVEFDLDFSRDIIERQWLESGYQKEKGKGTSPADHGGFSVLTYEPLLLGKVAPFIW